MSLVAKQRVVFGVCDILFLVGDCIVFAFLSLLHNVGQFFPCYQEQQ